MTEGVKITTRGTAKLNKGELESTSPSLQSIDTKLNSILQILEKNSNDIVEIKKEQKDMCESIELCHATINDFKQLISTQDLKIRECENEVQKTKKDTYKFGKSVEKVQREVRDLEQYSHRNNLIIYGIPEDNDEKIMFVIRRLATALHFQDWSEKLVDAVHRMGKYDPTNTSPRPIIIRFVRRLDKDAFLNKRKERRNLKASDLGFSSEDSIYVNESLTPENRDLLKKTRDAAKAKGYSQVWTANCSIFVRRNKDTDAIKIRSDVDIDSM
ncbi:uncharacterized protein LOC128991735 [Macrosteles quadrilineatus]|uniref:uncharacterized protein LOC128991735 n=1 Tax=Macrosteles quadrilineatus TaxID=74068 RepID=UPI0023E1CFD4|nr:uncharacterized protein LOC128991735 [Macrosteles quadrilineatus]